MCFKRNIWHEKGNINSNALVLGGVMVGGCVLAVILARYVASASYQVPALIFGVIIATVCTLSLGKNFWLLIPLLSPFSGSIGLIRIPFSYSELGAIAAVTLFVFHLAMHRKVAAMGFGLLDWLVLANLALLAQAYVRNPAGIFLIQTDIIGGRSYLTVILLYLSYIVLSSARASERQARLFPWFVCVPMIIAGFIAAITAVFPFASSIIYPFYSNVNIEALTDIGIGNSETKRLSGLSDLAGPLLLLISSLMAPIRFIFPLNLIGFTVFWLSLMGIGLSGFRNQVVQMVISICICSVLWRRSKDIIPLFFAGLLAVVVICATQSSGVQMPYQFQRALSFIPFIDWDQEAQKSADESTEWRVEMWREALATNRYIKNKTWGDGFGFRLDDFKAMQQKVMGWGGSFSEVASNEVDMVKGSFHSGPLTTIRVVGWVGLLFFTPLLIGIAVYSFKLCNETYGTPFFSWSIAIGLQNIYMPFGFFFVFGDYKWNIGLALLGIGYLKLLDGSFRKWLADNHEVQVCEATGSPLDSGTVAS